MAEKNKLTPVMQQYVDMKSENPDALLMFRLGDFYESFFEDAKNVSEITGLTLGSRTFANVGEIMKEGFRAYDREVKQGIFPEAEHGYKIDEEIIEGLK